MAVKTKKKSIYAMFEGYRDGYFLEHLAECSNIRYNPKPCNGGSANQIVTNGIKHSAWDISVYVFFDEDFESKPKQKISDETLEGLAKAWNINKDALGGCAYRNLQTLNKNLRNPILIVSYPQSIEGLLLRLLGIPLQNLEGKTTAQLKNEFASFLDNILLQNEDNEKLQRYDDKISKYSEEIIKLQQSDPQNKNHCKSLKAKIEECERNKNKVLFMRFLKDKLPVPVIAAKRTEIFEVDMLLNAFGL